MSTNHYDVAILGGGTIGLSSAYYCAASGKKTILFEQNAFYNDKGSSDGYSRMFRIMYSDPTMAMLAESSFALWHEIEEDTGVQLLKTNGLLFYGLSGQSVEGDLQQCQDTMTELGIPYQRYDRAGLKDNYTVFRDLPPEYWGLNQASSATTEVQQSLRTFHDAAIRKGATLLDYCPAMVVNPEPGGKPYTIATPHGTFTADSLIIAAGAWSNNVFQPFGLQLNLEIWQMNVAYFQVDPSLEWPMWFEFGPTVNGVQQQFYGFPPLERPGYIKVSCEFTNDKYEDPRQCSYQPNPDILRQISEFVAKRFRGVDPTVHDPATCLYTMSADGQMVLDTLPGYPNVAVLTGESGRAFKFTPLFGRILMQLATTGKTPYDISEFRIERKGIIKEA
ncbi:MAG: FAD-dependent oxidoreductase [Telluria sp.]